MSLAASALLFLTFALQLSTRASAWAPTPAERTWKAWGTFAGNVSAGPWRSPLPYSLARLVLPTGNVSVFAGGIFSGVSYRSLLGVEYAVASANVAAWDRLGNAWVPVGDGAGVFCDGSTPACVGVVTAMAGATLAEAGGAAALQGLYVGGSFSRAGDAPVANLARWDPLAWEWTDVGGGVRGGFADRKSVV